MARDPDQTGAFVFDLVDDDTDLEPPAAAAGSAAAETPDDDGAELVGPPPSAGLGGRLRVLAPVAALLAVVLGTGFAVDGVRDSVRMERMRDARGGVVDVSSPLEETWAWEGAVGPFGSMTRGLTNDVAVLGGLLAFQSERRLVGLDPATGDEAWVVELGAAPDCGPMGYAGLAEITASTLVCVAGPDRDRQVTVVGPDGVAGAARSLGTADLRRYGRARPGPDGTVLRAQRVGPEPVGALDSVECTESTWECTGTVEAGRDLEIRAEDAVTGEERWSVTVPFRPTAADRCNNWSGTSWSSTGGTTDFEQMIDTEGFGARTTGELVRLYGCGIEAGVTTTGEVLGLGLEPGMSEVSPVSGGGYIEYEYDEDEDDVRITLYSAEGDVVREFDGRRRVLEPDAVDTVEPGLLIAVGPDAPEMRAYEVDGSQRWGVSSPADVTRFIAQVAGTAVVASWSGMIHGLDLATGAERWSWNVSDTDEAQPGEWYEMRGFTDGDSVLLATHSGNGGIGMVSLDARSGAVLWEREASADRTGGGFDRGLVAVDGNLVDVTPRGVRGLG